MHDPCGTPANIVIGEEYESPTRTEHFLFVRNACIINIRFDGMLRSRSL